MKYYRVKAYDRKVKMVEEIENILRTNRYDRTLDIPKDDWDDPERHYRIKDEIKNILNEREIWV